MKKTKSITLLTSLLLLSYSVFGVEAVEIEEKRGRDRAEFRCVDGKTTKKLRCYRKGKLVKKWVCGRKENRMLDDEIEYAADDACQKIFAPKKKGATEGGVEDIPPRN